MGSLKFQPPVIAHRGASAYAPENTMAAFIKAAQLGVKWVEFDVMQTASGDVMIFHDELLNRTSNGVGSFADYPTAYLQSLDAGFWFAPGFSGARIPSLSELLSFLYEMKISANIELKAVEGHEEKLVLRVLNEIQANPPPAGVTILYSSFSINTLKLLRQHTETSLIGLLMHEWQPNWRETCKTLNCASVNVNQALMTMERVQLIKASGLPVLCYTVNEKSRADELYAWGVDAVFSDAPDSVCR